MKQDENEDSDKTESKSHVVDEEKEDNEENEGEGEKVAKELIEKNSKLSIVKAVQEGSELGKDEKIPSPPVNVSATVPGVNKSGENKSESEGGSEVKPVDQRSNVKSKKNNKQGSRKEEEDEEEGDEEGDEEDPRHENAEEDEDAEKAAKKGAAVDKERGVNKRDEVNDEDEKADDESEEALDDAEKVQQSMQLPPDDRIRMQQGGPKGPKAAGGDRFPVAGDINKLEKDMVSKE